MIYRPPPLDIHHPTKCRSSVVTSECYVERHTDVPCQCTSTSRQRYLNDKNKPRLASFRIHCRMLKRVVKYYGLARIPVVALVAADFNPRCGGACMPAEAEMQNKTSIRRTYMSQDTRTCSELAKLCVKQSHFAFRYSVDNARCFSKRTAYMP
eukprot:TRINITY_DN67840_c0_g1_i1.p1 TRINITY_DN67840_c0_g1~~TRINITY_DN67840_c0_g1_i1.p1  ORF type:complete len:153 (-),score=1.61 TRINITY_DN67840_c0_g1_i1:111-569(-)